jgi:rRNA small subunit pseudouridine methyltransferase Nep1
MELNVVIAESALEIVPEALWRHSSVLADARRRGVEPRDILLDRSLHHAAMLRLDDGFRRGRPDLVHLTLLTLTSTPLNQDGKLRVCIHTIDDNVLEFAPGARPPKSYDRFRNLVEKMLTERPSEGVVRFRRSSLPRLLKAIRSDLAVGFTIQGSPSSFDAVASELVERERPTMVIGGFPKGHFLPEDIEAFDRLVRVHDRPLDAHVVAARAVYEVEKSLSRTHR